MPVRRGPNPLKKKPNVDAPNGWGPCNYPKKFVAPKGWMMIPPDDFIAEKVMPECNATKYVDWVDLSKYVRRGCIPLELYGKKTKEEREKLFANIAKTFEAAKKYHHDKGFHGKANLLKLGSELRAFNARFKGEFIPFEDYKKNRLANLLKFHYGKYKNSKPVAVKYNAKGHKLKNQSEPKTWGYKKTTSSFKFDKKTGKKVPVASRSTEPEPTMMIEETPGEDWNWFPEENDDIEPFLVAPEEPITGAGANLAYKTVPEPSYNTKRSHNAPTQQLLLEDVPNSSEHKRVRGTIDPLQTLSSPKKPLGQTKRSYNLATRRDNDRVRDVLLNLV